MFFNLVDVQNNALAGAKVELRPLFSPYFTSTNAGTQGAPITNYTDANGYVSYSNPVPGLYSLTYTPSGYVSSSQSNSTYQKYLNTIVYLNIPTFTGSVNGFNFYIAPTLNYTASILPYAVSSSFALTASYVSGSSNNNLSSSYSTTSSFSNISISSSYSPNLLMDITDNTTTHCVGINNTNPTFPLDVNGNIGNSIYDNNYFQLDDSNGNMVLYSGRVGIFTTNPQYTLDVNGSIGNGNYTGNYLSFNSNNAYVSLMSQAGMGYIGINNLSPNYSLDVAGNINFSGNLLNNGSIYVPPSSSYSKNSLSSSYALTASYVSGSNSVSSSYSFTSSYSNTASYANNSVSSSVTNTASYYNGTNIIITGNVINNNSQIGLSGNFIGYQTGLNATNAIGSNFLGYNVGNGALSASNSNFIGDSAGYGAINAYNSNFLGYAAGQNAITASNSNFLGNLAGNSATSASNSNFLGNNAGNSAIHANNSIFIGYKSGYNSTVNNSAGNSSILIGDYTNTAYPDSIAIGKGTSNSTNNQFNIGNVLFGLNIYSGSSTTFTPQTNGQVGIGLNNPVNALDVSGNISCSVITASLHYGTASYSKNNLSSSYSSVATNISNAGVSTTTNSLTFVDNNPQSQYYLSGSAIMFVGTSSGYYPANTDALIIAPTTTPGNTNQTSRLQFGTATNGFYALDLSYVSNITNFNGTLACNGVGYSTQILGFGGGDSEYGVSEYAFHTNISNYLPILIGNASVVDSGSSVAFVLRNDTAITSSGGTFIVWENGQYGAKLLTMLANGNLGLGLTSPKYTLDISGSSNSNIASGSIRASQSGSTNMVQINAKVSNYTEINITNTTGSVSASADIVATNNLGNNNGYYVDVGINSSNYNQGFVGQSNDAYLYTTGSNLYIGSITPNGSTYLFGGGYANTSSVVITGSNVGIGTTTPVNSLDVSGNISASVITASLFNPIFVQMPYSSSAHALTPTVYTGSTYFTFGTTNYIYTYSGTKWISGSLSK